MFRRLNQRFWKLMLCVVGGASLTLGSALPAVAQVVGCQSTDPYLFILLDTSGSMNFAPACSTADFSAGACSRLCNAPECFVPLQADSPDSKLFQVKAGLYDALSSVEAESVQLGFATFNQDALYARAKHWLYEAAGNGVSIPGHGPFPATGSREVLGRSWTCDEGSGDNEAGCLPTNPADLSDAWELERVRAFAKGGETFTTAVTFYVRQAPTVYRIRYTPVSGALGSSVSLKVRVERCQTSTCSTVVNLGEPTLSYSVVSEQLVWDNGAFRTEPIGYFSQSGSADASASNTCAGWEPNTDSNADKFNNYSLHWPTVTGDPRGSLFDQGDVIPLDWLTDHRQDVQKRLAPNTVYDPLATPDFRTSPYLQDSRIGSELFLRLKDENARPLIATGSTPHGGALRSFRIWYAGCGGGSCPPGSGWLDQAAAQDPDFFCRPRSVLLITDGADTCGTLNPCADAAALYAQFGVRTFVVAYGVDPPANQPLSCITQYGHTVMQFPRNPGELTQALRDIFVEAGQP